MKKKWPAFCSVFGGKFLGKFCFGVMYLSQGDEPTYLAYLFRFLPIYPKVLYAIPILVLWHLHGGLLMKRVQLPIVK